MNLGDKNQNNIPSNTVPSNNIQPKSPASPSANNSGTVIFNTVNSNKGYIPSGNTPIRQNVAPNQNAQFIPRQPAPDVNKQSNPAYIQNIPVASRQNSVPQRQISNNHGATRVMPAVPGTNANISNIANTPNTANPQNMGRPPVRTTVVPAKNGTPVGNFGATRVMPKVPSANGVQSGNTNATRIMPRVSAATNSSVQKTSTTPGYIPVNAVPNGNPGINTNNGVYNGNKYGQNSNGNMRYNPPVQHVRSGSNNSPAGNMTKKRTPKKRFGCFIGASKFILYIAFVIVASIFISKYIIGAGNDIFAFVKDSYNYTDTVYSTKGEATNSLRITETYLKGDKFEFEYTFATPLSEDEKNALDASVVVVDASNNSILHNFGKFTQDVLDGKSISLDMSNADMLNGEYILRFTVGTGNSVFYITEFTFSRKPVNITVDEDASTSDIAKLLKKNGLIDYPSAFNLYARLKKGENKSLGTTYVAGDHMLYHGMDYDELLYALSPKINVRSIVKLTFPEGSTVDDIINILIKGGVKNSREDYIRVMENYGEFDYRFIDLLEKQGLDKGRVYSLEGYLFPDTYEFYTDSSPEAVIDKFLANFDVKFDDSFYDEAEKLGLTVDEVVRIASLVESEAGNPDDKANISSVFHNRLKNPAVYPKLESDATSDYSSYNLKAALKLTEFKCSKCGKKESKQHSKCSECGNNNSYKEYKCASFTVKLAGYDLIDSDYYINFSVSTDTTRASSDIYFTKKTDADKAVYTVTNKNVTLKPELGDVGMVITEATIDKNGVLTCEVMLDHGFDPEDFVKFPMRLNLFRTEYDTYNTNGLMPGAVSNPGYESIIAALYPNTTNYYFFVADSDGNSHFASTLDQHNQNIADLVRNGKAVSAN